MEWLNLILQEQVLTGWDKPGSPGAGVTLRELED